MFGFYRFVLALFVVVAHLFSYISIHCGHFAVYGFFMLSGYLMTSILKATYGYSARGIKRYLLNRFLRIFPAYFLVVILSFILVYLYPEQSSLINEHLKIPDSLSSFMSNMFIFGIGPGWKPSQIETMRLVPPVWALHNELVFYLLIPILSKNFTTTLAWAIASVGIGVYSVFFLTFADFYSTIQAASLPFSLGSIYYYLVHEEKHKTINMLLSKHSSAFITIGILSTILLLFFAKQLFKLEGNLIVLYLSLIPNSLLLLGMTRARKNFILKYDRFWGSLSYPIYLIHWQVRALAGIIFGLEAHNYHKFRLISIYSLPLILIISYLITRFESVFEKTRFRIRQN